MLVFCCRSNIIENILKVKTLQYAVILDLHLCNIKRHTAEDHWFFVFWYDAETSQGGIRQTHQKPIRMVCNSNFLNELTTL